MVLKTLRELKALKALEHKALNLADSPESILLCL